MNHFKLMSASSLILLAVSLPSAFASKDDSSSSSTAAKEGAAPGLGSLYSDGIKSIAGFMSQRDINNLHGVSRHCNAAVKGTNSRLKRGEKTSSFSKLLLISISF